MNVQEIQLDGITYTIVRHIGSGGMAEVYKARRKSNGFSMEKQVALKRILPNLSRNEHFRRNFINEANILGHLQHSNLVEVYNLHQNGNDLYLSMEFIEGTSLEELLEYQRQQKRPLSPSLLVAIMLQALEGLDAAHTAKDQHGRELKIIHRDLKPSNILINVDGVVKIVDFGVAKAANRRFETVEVTAKGTASYMAPEQIIGEPEVNEGSDLFSLGAVLYELITLKRLFDGLNVFAILKQVSDMDIDAHLDKVLPDSDPFKPILKKALARDQDRRYQHAADMLRDIQTLKIQAATPRLLGNMVQVVRPPDEDEVEEARTRVVHLSHQDEGVVKEDPQAKQQSALEAPGRTVPPPSEGADEDEADQTVLSTSDEKETVVKPNPHPPTSHSVPTQNAGTGQNTWPQQQGTLSPLAAPSTRPSNAPTVPITASRPGLPAMQAGRGVSNGFEPPMVASQQQRMNPPSPMMAPQQMPLPSQPMGASAQVPAHLHPPHMQPPAGVMPAHVIPANVMPSPQRMAQPTPGSAAFPTSGTHLPPGYAHPMANPDRDPYGPVAQPAPTLRLTAATEPSSSSVPAVLGGLLLGALLLGLLYLGSLFYGKKEAPPPPAQPAPAPAEPAPAQP